MRRWPGRTRPTKSACSACASDKRQGRSDRPGGPAPSAGPALGVRDGSSLTCPISLADARIGGMPSARKEPWSHGAVVTDKPDPARNNGTRTPALSSPGPGGRCLAHAGACAPPRKTSAASGGPTDEPPVPRPPVPADRSVRQRRRDPGAARPHGTGSLSCRRRWPGSAACPESARDPIR
jgi:hypothetical protein